MTEANLCILAGGQALRGEAILREALTTDWRVETWKPSDPEERRSALFSTATAIVTGFDSIGRTLFDAIRNAPRLRLVQLPFSGYEWLQQDTLPAGSVACNVFGHQPGIAEFVLAGLFAFETQMCRLDAEFRAEGWPSGGRQPSYGISGELGGKSLGIIGYGQIGRELAQRAAALGLSVIATARRPRPAEPPLSFLGTQGDVERVLRESDYVALTCELNDSTEGLINAARIACMKPSAVLVNVARGPVVEEAALYEALKSRRIRGAIIDVWWNYPRRGSETTTRPSNLPFHDLDNVIMSPHRAGSTREGEPRRYKMIARNLDRLVRGETLENIVMRAR